jgi:hypothetical protein
MKCSITGISSITRRQMARASTLAASGKFLSDKMRARHVAKPITLRRADYERQRLPIL